MASGDAGSSFGAPSAIWSETPRIIAEKTRIHMRRADRKLLKGHHDDLAVPDGHAVLQGRMKLPRFDCAKEHAAQNIGPIVEQPGRFDGAVRGDDYFYPREIGEIDRGRQLLMHID